MKKITATLIAGLFATTAFAQVPDSPVAKTTVETKDANTAVLVDKQAAQADLTTTTTQAQEAATTDAKGKVVSKTTKTTKTTTGKADAKDAKAAADGHGAHGAAASQTK